MGEEAAHGALTAQFAAGAAAIDITRVTLACAPEAVAFWYKVAVLS